jgi:uncharacterized beta-barrel protein YwiB (DUF1934 family)
MGPVRDFQRQVPMRLVRREWDDSTATPDVTTFQVEDAMWSLRRGIHYLMYQSPDDEQTESDRTTLKLDEAELTLMRFGRVRWTHHFEVGADRESVLAVEGLQLPVQISTQSVSSCITDQGGRVHLLYAMNMGGSSSSVELQLEFGEGVFSNEDAESTI